MRRTCLRLAAAPLALMSWIPNALAQTSPPLSGDWQQDDRSTTIRIAPCPNRNGLCAIMIAERPVAGQKSQLNQVVATDFQQTGKASWKGKYVVDATTMKASAKLTGNDRLTIRICALPFLCDTVRFIRQ